MTTMKNILLGLIIALCFTVAASGTATAIPSLQLDILGGTYDWSTQTIVANGNSFTLFAYLQPTSSNTLSDTYYISAAVIPSLSNTAGGYDLGSFSINGSTIDVTRDMVYGIPPLEANLARDPGDLAPHGVYTTYFTETGFSFTSTQQTSAYNTQLLTGRGLVDGTGMYYVAFNIDTSGLNDGYQIHFDLYNTSARSGGDIDVNNLFAPFSHDAESSKVPEPATVLLLGSGLVGLALYRFRFVS